MQTVGLDYRDSAGTDQWGRLYSGDPRKGQPVLNREGMYAKVMPDVKGMGLKDALFLLENMELRVVPNGKGKVKTQSISPGIALQKNETIFIQLN